MGLKTMAKGAPAVPDPYQTSAAQAEANIKAIKESAKISAVDQYAPWGSTTYSRNGEGIPTGQTIALAPAERQIYDTNNAVKNLFAGSARNLAGALPQQPFAFNAGNSPDAVANALYQRNLARITPDLDQADNLAAVNLVNRGIPIGSEAYTTEMNRLAQNRANALTGLSQDATLAAGAEEDRLLQQQLGIRNQNYNELAALMSGAAGIQMPTFQQTPTWAVKPPDVEGNVYRAAQIEAQQQASMMNGLFGLFGALIPKISDRRAKTDIRRIGVTDAGLPIYTFRYRDGGVVEMGVMADEVEKRFPEAVLTIGGIKHVDYGAIG